MPLCADIAVLGLGVVGSWALHSASSHGTKAIGVEMFDLGHAKGSSHGGARVTRNAYFEHPDYVPLIRWSTDHIRALEREVGESLMERCGTLLLARRGADLLTASAESARQFGIAVQHISRDDLRRRYPHFDLPKSFVGLLEPDAGFIRVEPSLAATQRSARERGARILDNTKVTSLTSMDDGVLIRTNREDIRAGAVVVCAGSWSSELLPEYQPWLHVTRQVQAWLTPHSDDAPSLTPESLPCWLIDRGSAAPVYGIPRDPSNPDRGAKIAVHGEGVVTTPSAVSRHVRSEESAALQALAARWLGPTRSTIGTASVCLYTSTADGHFIVERSRHDPRIAVVAGLSGHGFKMGPALGHAAVELALHGRTSLPVNFLSRRGRAPFSDYARQS
jgi:sarcosine oxidase